MYVQGGMMLWRSADGNDGRTAALLEVKEARCFGWCSHEHVSLVLVSYVDLELVKDIIFVTCNVIIYTNRSLYKLTVYYTTGNVAVKSGTGTKQMHRFKPSLIHFHLWISGNNTYSTRRLHPRLAINLHGQSFDCSEHREKRQIYCTVYGHHDSGLTQIIEHMSLNFFRLLFGCVE